VKTTTNHHSDEGKEALARACIAEAKRRKRPELAGDFYCRAVHESRDGRRAGYNAKQVAWQAAGHLLKNMKAACVRTPEHFGGDALIPITGTDYGDTFTRQMEFAFDLSQAIGERLAVHRMQTVLALRAFVREPLKVSRANMPPKQLDRGPLARRIKSKRATLMAA